MHLIISDNNIMTRTEYTALAAEHGLEMANLVARMEGVSPTQVDLWAMTHNSAMAYTKAAHATQRRRSDAQHKE